MSKKSNWTFDNIPDQAGRIAIVTGSNSGIGYETARMLAAKGAHVVMACRTLKKAESAKLKIIDQHAEASVEVMQLDLGSLASVRSFAAEFLGKFQRLDLLINNAGVMVPPLSKTEDGFELQFGTNHLGHFALTGLLLNAITATPESRIVVVSSTAHNWGAIDFENLNAEKSYSKWPFYGQSKLANLLFAYELQRKLTDWGSTTMVTAAHPGWTSTGLQKHAGLAQRLNRFFAMQPQQGALPTLYAATSPKATQAAFYGPDGFMEMNGYPTQVKSNKRSHDRKVATRLWEVSETMTGVKFNAPSPQPVNNHVVL